MIKREEEINLYCIKQFMDDINFDTNDISDIMKIVDKIESCHNGSNIPLKTVLRTLESTEKQPELSTDGGGRYSFTIIFNEHPKYNSRGYSREAAILKAASQFCKDLVLTNQMDKDIKWNKMLNGPIKPKKRK